MEKNIKNKIKYLIDKKTVPEEICRILDIEMQDLYAAVLELKGESRPYDIIDGIPVKVRQSDANYVNINNKESEIAVVSDLHLGSIYDRTDLIRRVYTDCLQRGVSTILCAGDVTDGYYPERKRYCKSQKVAGFNETLEYAFKNLPRIGDVKMYAISGNHDDTFATGRSKSILGELSRRREDFIYLGKDSANIEIGGAKIKMLHGFSKYDTMEKRIEDLYDSTSALTRPDLLILGHIHTSFYKKIGDTHILQCASLMDNPDFSKNVYDEEKSFYYVKFIYDEFGNIKDIQIEQDFFEDTLERKRIR